MDQVKETDPITSVFHSNSTIFTNTDWACVCAEVYSENGFEGSIVYIPGVRVADL